MIAIRPATSADGAAVAALYAPYVTGPGVTFELVAPDASAMAGRIATTLATHPWLIAERDGVVAGYAYAGLYGTRPAYRWTAETTIYVGADQRGQGVGRLLYPALLDVLRAQRLRSALARVAMPNPGSTRLHTACGFRHFGTHGDAGYKHGTWHDIAYWSLTLNTADPPEEPLAYAALTDTTAAAGNGA